MEQNVHRLGCRACLPGGWLRRRQNLAGNFLRSKIRCRTEDTIPHLKTPDRNSTWRRTNETPIYWSMLFGALFFDLISNSDSDANIGVLMNRKVYPSILGLIFLTLSVLAGCGGGSSPAPTVESIAATSGTPQSATVGTAFAPLVA